MQLPLKTSEKIYKIGLYEYVFRGCRVKRTSSEEAQTNYKVTVVKTRVPNLKEISRTTE
jgi:hypothetical protein